LFRRRPEQAGAVHLHLRIDSFKKIEAERGAEPVEKNENIGRLARGFFGIALLQHLDEFVHLDARAPCRRS
tara:strand:+ start:13092 stop:13304 length:213 start_codon:yes stop_codon:yes gene_type:complete